MLPVSDSLSHTKKVYAGLIWKSFMSCHTRHEIQESLSSKKKTDWREIQNFSSRLATFLSPVWASSTNKLRGITFGCRDFGNFRNCQFQGKDYYKTSASLCAVLGKEALGFLNALARNIWVDDNGECDDDNEDDFDDGDNNENDDDNDENDDDDDSKRKYFSSNQVSA